MDHVLHLANTIGARGSSTKKEEEAARYADVTLKQAGLGSVIERFQSGPSGWCHSVWFARLMLVSAAIYIFGGRWGAIVAAVVGVVVFGSLLLEMTFRPGPLRWVLPKGDSQNVWTRVLPTDSPIEQVVLLGHLDTHRTPLVFSSDGWIRFFRILFYAAMLSGIYLIALFAVDIIFDIRWWRLLSLAGVPAIVILLVLSLQAEKTPYTVGANDNATGAAIALGLAERLKNEPLAHTAVWVVLSGCEEVGCYGADHFAQNHGDELAGAAWIALDSLGSASGGLYYLEAERFLCKTTSDSGLVAIAGQVADRHPELNVRAFKKISDAYTEGSIGGKYKFKVLTLISLGADGIPTEWHRPTDVVQKLDIDCVKRAEAFVWEFLKEIDRQAFSRKKAVGAAG
jgi:hypothetical protein